ncbi:MAG TPA: prepilin peptidase [Rhodanobacteraceae bacterium]
MSVFAYLPAWYWIAVGGVFGTLVGSFLNVVILRLPQRVAFLMERRARCAAGASFVAGAAPLGIVVEHSRCPHCQHRIAPWDNVPVLSWILLRGRCRHCKAPISLQYPAVEALIGLAGAASVWRFGPTWLAVFGLACAWGLVGSVGIALRGRHPVVA